MKIYFISLLFLISSCVWVGDHQESSNEIQSLPVNNTNTVVESNSTKFCWSTKIYKELLNPVFSNRENIFGFIANTDSGSMAVINWKEWKSYFNVENLILSEDGKHSAYITRDKVWLYKLVLDDLEMKYTYKSIDHAMFWGDLKKVIFIWKNDNGDYTVTQNDTKIITVDDYDMTSVKKVKNELFFIAKIWDFWFVMKNGIKISDPYLNLDVHNFVVSTDGEHFIITWNSPKYPNKEKVLIKDGIELWIYESIDSVSISHNWEHFTFSFVENNISMISRDLKNIESSYQWIGFPIYASNGMSFAFWARNPEKTIIIKDDQEIGINYMSVGVPNYSPSWKHFFFQARTLDWKSVLVYDGKELWDYNNEDMTFQAFSEDESNFVFWYLNGNKWNILTKDSNYKIDTKNSFSTPSVLFTNTNQIYLYGRNIVPVMIDINWIKWIDNDEYELFNLNIVSDGNLVEWVTSLANRNRYIIYWGHPICQ